MARVVANTKIPGRLGVGFSIRKVLWDLQAFVISPPLSLQALAPAACRIGRRGKMSGVGVATTAPKPPYLLEFQVQEEHQTEAHADAKVASRQGNGAEELGQRRDVEQ